MILASNEQKDFKAFLLEFEYRCHCRDVVVLSLRPGEYSTDLAFIEMASVASHCPSHPRTCSSPRRRRKCRVLCGPASVFSPAHPLQSLCRYFTTMTPDCTSGKHRSSRGRIFLRRCLHPAAPRTPAELPQSAPPRGRPIKYPNICMLRGGRFSGYSCSLWVAHPYLRRYLDCLCTCLRTQKLYQPAKSFLCR